MGNDVNEANTNNQDRIMLLQQRIIALKKECQDVQFCAYLDMIWNELKNAESTIDQLEKLVETNYQIYQRKVGQQYGQQTQQYVQQSFYTQPQQHVQQSQQYAQQIWYTQAQQYTQNQQYMQQRPEGE